MPTNFSEFFEKMDEVQWFRMIVCFLPGLVFAKLSGYFANATVSNWISTILLVGGVALYVLWGLIRSVVRGEDESLDQDEGLQADGEERPALVTTHGTTEISASDQLKLLGELRILCAEEESRSEKLIAVEISANPQLSYADATRVALRRYKLVG